MTGKKTELKCLTRKKTELKSLLYALSLVVVLATSSAAANGAGPSASLIHGPLAPPQLDGLYRSN